MLPQPLADGKVKEVVAWTHRAIDELIEVMLGSRLGGCRKRRGLGMETRDCRECNETEGMEAHDYMIRRSP